MTIYTAHFYTVADYAKHRIEADTAEQALQRARQIESDEPEILNFRGYDTTDGVEHIEIWGPSRRTVAEWESEDRLLRLAARDLFEALQFCDMTLADLECSERKGYIAHAIEMTRAALAKAKPPAGGQL